MSHLLYIRLPADVFFKSLECVFLSKLIISCLTNYTLTLHVLNPLLRSVGALHSKLAHVAGAVYT